MKVCMIGLGSIGRRHIHNLAEELKRRNIEFQIDALRSGKKKLSDELDSMICTQYYQISDMPEDYDIVFVTNPTSLHYDTIQKVIGKTKHIFIEKPVFETTRYDIKTMPLKKDGIYYVACPMRHKSIMKYIKKEIIERERIVAARIISTSYLPSWRKEIDYRSVYSARESLGGGVTRDLIHEWDYAVYLFGMPDRVLHMKEHMSRLEIDSDDISIYIARYPEMLLEMHLDYIGHKTERILQLFTDDRRIDADFISDTICEYVNNKLAGEKKFASEDCYKKEMEYFLSCIEKKQDNMNTISNAYQVLKIAMTEEFG